MRGSCLRRNDEKGGMTGQEAWFDRLTMGGTTHQQSFACLLLGGSA